MMSTVPASATYIRSLPTSSSPANQDTAASILQGPRSQNPTPEEPFLVESCCGPSIGRNGEVACIHTQRASTVRCSAGFAKVSHFRNEGRTGQKRGNGTNPGNSLLKILQNWQPY